MANLSSNFLGIRSPNPFWLASAPPTDKKYNVKRALDAGCGGCDFEILKLKQGLTAKAPRRGGSPGILCVT